uniref:Uncharacterized protein n=1 Tax=Rhizophora mucronata TaxID=61149 RepID=A0A2P2Q5Y5_RHIMU
MVMLWRDESIRSKSFAHAMGGTWLLVAIFWLYSLTTSHFNYRRLK